MPGGQGVTVGTLPVEQRQGNLDLERHVAGIVVAGKPVANLEIVEPREKGQRLLPTHGDRNCVGTFGCPSVPLAARVGSPSKRRSSQDAGAKRLELRPHRLLIRGAGG